MMAYELNSLLSGPLVLVHCDRMLEASQLTEADMRGSE